MYHTIMGFTRYYPPIKICTIEYNIETRTRLVLLELQLCAIYPLCFRGSKNKYKRFQTQQHSVCGPPYSGLDETISGPNEKANYRSRS